MAWNWPLLWEEATRLDPGADARSLRPKHSNGEGQLAAAVRRLENVSDTVSTRQLPFVSFSDFWEPHLTSLAPQGAYVASLSQARREVLRQGLRQRLLGDRADGPFALRAKALAVKGTVPDWDGDT